MTEVLKLI